jgi:hypothetical protein
MAEATCREAGRKGGLATAARHGTEHFRNAGVIGARRLHELHSPEEFRRWGQMALQKRQPSETSKE